MLFRSDSREQWQERFAAVNPQSINLLGLHLYHPRANGKGYGSYGVAGLGLRENIAAAVEVSRKTGKPLWLGEFGPGVGENDPQERKLQVREFLSLIEEFQIPLSAYWVYDTPNSDVAVWNAAPGNENEFVFQMIAETNGRLSKP